jgi:hypothetical protein
MQQFIGRMLGTGAVYYRFANESAPSAGSGQSLEKSGNALKKLDFSAIF